MENIYLKVIEKNQEIGEGTITVTDKFKLAKALADMMREFNKWKDRKLSMNLMGVSSDDVYVWEQQLWRHDDLFRYWHIEIFLKKQSNN